MPTRKTLEKRKRKNINDIPEVVKAVTDAVLNEAAGDEDASITITDTGVRVDYTNPSSHTKMTLYGACQTCAMEAFGELDTDMAFYCQQCWEQYSLLF